MADLEHKESEFYMQGRGNRNDAIFRTEKSGMIFVLAETGMSGCICDRMNAREARIVYRRLKKLGWNPALKSRTDFNALYKRIND